MRITITARHCEIPSELRTRTLEIVERVAKVAHRPQHAEVVFDNDHHQKVVELRMYLARGAIHVASAEADDFQSALDRAVAKLRSQLDKKGGRPARRAGTA